MKSFYMPQAIIESLALLSGTGSVTSSISEVICNYVSRNFDKSVLSDEAMRNYGDATKAFIKLAVPLIDEANFGHWED